MLPTLFRCLALLSALLLAAPARADPVTEWTRLADQLGHGSANWRTLAIMHQAMHDAWNAALPTYGRWYPPEPGEPRGTGALPQAAMAAAAHGVLVRLHPDGARQADQLLQVALARTADGSSEQAGVYLGDAIGAAAVARRQGDGYERRHLFAKGSAAGSWRPTPLEFGMSGTTETRPFLFARDADVPGVPPPPPGSEPYRRWLDETARLGSAGSTERTQDQTDAALFWAYQSSQRGFVMLAASLLEAHPRPEGLAAHARIMSLLTAAMADSAILAWFEKERYSTWRPITAIRTTMPQWSRWEPLIDTPPHPEYPSGHAADCFTGAAVIQELMPDLRGPIVYAAQQGQPSTENVGMGQHAQGGETGIAKSRGFPSLAAAAEECSNSRIWAGAHFRSADEEARRIATIIARRAAALLPPAR